MGVNEKIAIKVNYGVCVNRVGEWENNVISSMKSVDKDTRFCFYLLVNLVLIGHLKLVLKKLEKSTAITVESF